MAKMITVTIDPETAEVEVDASGYKGKGCHAVQDAFTKNLGGDVITERRKPEFNATTTNVVCAKR